MTGLARSAIWPVATVLALVAWTGGARAQQPDDPARDEEAIFGDSPDPAAGDHDEDAMFGGDDAAPESPDVPGDSATRAAPAASTGNRDDDVLGEHAAPMEGLEIIDDTLAIGGLVYMRLAHTIRKDTDVEDNSLSMPNLVDMYFDARPGDRVRAYVRGRVTYDPTLDPDGTSAFGQSQGSNPDVLLDQLWMKFDIARAVYMTIGKQPIRWGTARLWNPVDVVNAARRDPLALFDERTGVTLAKVHIPVESLGWNFYVVGMLDEASGLDKLGVAGRAEFVIETAELAISAVYQKGRKPRLGFDLSAGLGDFDLYGELGVAFGSDVPVYAGSFDLQTLTFPCEQDVDDKEAIQATLGLSYGVNISDEDVMYLGLEGFWNQRGYPNEELYAWLLYQENFQPFYLGQWYAALYILLPSPGDWNDTSWTLSTLANLSDLSFLTRLDFSVRVLTWMDVQAYVAGHYGTEGGEFRFALDIPPIALPGQEPFDGIQLAPAILDLGLNLRIAI